MSCGQKCPKKGIKIDKSILRIEIFQNFEFLLFISAQITPKTVLTLSLYLIPIDSHDESQIYKYINIHFFGTVVFVHKSKTT